MSVTIGLLGLPNAIEQDCLRFVSLKKPAATLTAIAADALAGTNPLTIHKLAYLATAPNHEAVMQWASASPSATRPSLLVLVPARAEAPAAASPRIEALMTLPSPIHTLATQLLRIESDPAQTFAINDELAFCASSRSLIDPRAIRPSTSLTDKEAALMATLMAAAPKAVPREVLMHKVWGHDTLLDTHTLETHIYRLRNKCAKQGAEAIIHTTAEGYRFGV